MKTILINNILKIPPELGLSDGEYILTKDFSGGLVLFEQDGYEGCLEALTGGALNELNSGMLKRFFFCNSQLVALSGGEVYVDEHLSDYLDCTEPEIVKHKTHISITDPKRQMNKEKQ